MNPVRALARRETMKHKARKLLVNLIKVKFLNKYHVGSSNGKTWYYLDEERLINNRKEIIDLIDERQLMVNKNYQVIGDRNNLIDTFTIVRDIIKDPKEYLWISALAASELTKMGFSVLVLINNNDLTLPDIITKEKSDKLYDRDNFLQRRRQGPKGFKKYDDMWVQLDDAFNTGKTKTFIITKNTSWVVSKLSDAKKISEEYRRREYSSLQNSYSRFQKYSANSEIRTSEVRTSEVRTSYITGSYSIVGNPRSHDLEDRMIQFRKDNILVTAVLDGHGGSQVVDYILDNNLLNFLVRTGVAMGNKNIKEIRKSVVKRFKEIDNELRVITDGSGTTAIIALHNLETGQLYFINLGDSRAILFRDRNEPVIETEDQDPDNPKEVKLVRNRGGVVIQGRVALLDENRNVLMSDNQHVAGLGITRALGDFNLKKPKQKSNFVDNSPVITNPVQQFFMGKGSRSHSLESGMVYILVSDGITDVLDGEEVQKIFLNNVDNVDDLDENDLDEISRRIVKRSTTRWNKDDKTVIIVKVI